MAVPFNEQYRGEVVSNTTDATCKRNMTVMSVIIFSLLVGLISLAKLVTG